MVTIALRELLPRLRGSAATPPTLPDAPLPAPPLDLPLELGLTLFWGWQLPDELEVSGDRFNMTDLMFSNQRLVLEHGLGAFLKGAMRQPAGKVRHVIGTHPR